MRSIEHLVMELAAYLEASESALEQDFRDVLTGLPPFVDCARRLSADPVEVFLRASAGRSAGMAELAGKFARRDDIALGSGTGKWSTSQAARAID